MPPEFNIDEYSYKLPEDRIAKYPLAERSKSKLLLWDRGAISHHRFEQVPSLIAPDSLLVFNDTKVIAARLLFQKRTGATVEIFLLHPELPTRDIADAMLQKGSAVWSCLIGNKKKWKDGALICSNRFHTIRATYHDKDSNQVRFSWDKSIPFSELINCAGETPLPPYLKRKADREDSKRYQTVYSKNDGAVAAPTAGLHFTKSLINRIKSRNVKLEYMTLHVSAGTFKPVEAIDYRDHDMHEEQITINKDSLLNLLQFHDRIIAVGTTSLRILESLYWYGVLLRNNQDAKFSISKEIPYKNEFQKAMSFQESLNRIMNYMDKTNLSSLRGETEIFIYPGYEIKTAKGLFTNFHLPKSTLLLLVSCFTGQDWEPIYREALKMDYRFLSYGDSSLLLR